LRQEPKQSVTIEEAKIEHIEFEIAKRHKITGTVRDNEGNVLEGVKMKICPRGDNDVSTDGEGRFLMTYDPEWRSTQKDRTMYLVCRHEERNLAAAVLFNKDTKELDITLQPGVVITGKLADFDGEDIARATINVMLRGPSWGSPIGNDRITTDEQGNFEVKAVPPDHTYYINASSEGYAEDRSEKFGVKDAVNNRFDVGTLKLVVANLSVSGIVVDTHGEPVPGAWLYGFEEKGQPERTTFSDKDGKFTLEKVCAGNIRIMAGKEGTIPLRGLKSAKGGMTHVKIILRPQSIQPEPTSTEPRFPSSLVGKSLPDLKTVGIILAPNDIKNKKLLVCLWDIEQRPSRHFMTQLTKQAAKLKDKGIVVVPVQTSKTDEKVIRQWLKENDIPFPVGMTQEETKKTRFTWGIQSLPWLILTDDKHVVISEGFQLGELDDQLEHINHK
jgi:hypothetical protein